MNSTFPFKEKVDHTIENSDRVSGERILGIDPATGKQVSVRMARFRSRCTANRFER